MNNIYKKIGITILSILCIKMPYTQPKAPIIKTINIRNTSKNFKNMTCTKTIIEASSMFEKNIKLIAGITAISTAALISIGALMWYKKQQAHTIINEDDIRTRIQNEPTIRENILKYASIHRNKGRALLKNGCTIRE